MATPQPTAPLSPAPPPPERKQAAQALADAISRLDPKALTTELQSYNQSISTLKQAIVVVQSNIQVLNRKLDLLLEWQKNHP